MGWLDDELDAFEGSLGDPDEGGQADFGDASAPAPATDGVFGTEFTLDELAAKPGRWQELAAELIVARDERRVRVEAEALRKASEEALDSGSVESWDDPTFLAGLRAQVEADRQAASEAFLRGRRVELAKARWGEGTVKERMADEAARDAQVEAFLAGSDALESHPAFQAHEAELAMQARSAAFVRDRVSEADFGLAEAEAAIDGTFRAALAAVEG